MKQSNSFGHNPQIEWWKWKIIMKEVDALFTQWQLRFYSPHYGNYNKEWKKNRVIRFVDGKCITRLSVSTHYIKLYRSSINWPTKVRKLHTKGDHHKLVLYNSICGVHFVPCVSLGLGGVRMGSSILLWTLMVMSSRYSMAYG